MNCEMCGKETELFTAVIEGTELNVCLNCCEHGKVLQRIKPQIKARTEKKITQKPKEEIIEAIVPDYARKIKTAREKKGLTQKEFAREMQEKESLLQKMETGHFEPPIDIARKLEKKLHITLVEERKIENALQSAEKKTDKLTIGDMLKIKS